MQTQDSEVKQHATSLQHPLPEHPERRHFKGQPIAHWLTATDGPIHDEKAAVDMNHNNVIRDAPRSYAALGPSESNDNID